MQTIGRAARNSSGKVIMYADSVTGSMQRAITETERRRNIQMAYNTAHGIVPQTIKKDIRELMEISSPDREKRADRRLSEKERTQRIAELRTEMKKAAKLLEFEHAAALRDEIERLESEQ